jgi:hypothetical protein
MHDAMVVQIGDSREGGPNEVGSVGLVVVSFATDAVEQLASQSKISDQVDCSELAVACRSIYRSPYDCSWSRSSRQASRCSGVPWIRASGRRFHCGPNGHELQYAACAPDTHHVFPPRHQSLVDNFGRIVPPRINVHTLLDDRVAARTQCLACLVPAWLDLRLRLCLRRVRA